MYSHEKIIQLLIEGTRKGSLGWTWADDFTVRHGRFTIDINQSVEKTIYRLTFGEIELENWCSEGNARELFFAIDEGEHVREERELQAYAESMASLLSSDDKGFHE